MGLDTSHECWHGAYSGFRRFRNAIAQAAGWPMDKDGDYVLPELELTEENFQGEWPHGVPGDDPLLAFLAHSDCDGVIHPEQGRHIARRLREIAPLLPEIGAGHIWSYRGNCINFADGLDVAADDYEDVVFA